LHAQAQGAPVETVPNHLVWAILTTIFCCLPFGIVAIVFAAQVNSLFQAGNYDKAVEYSKKARTWSLVSCISLLIPMSLYIIIIIIIMIFGFAASSM